MRLCHQHCHSCAVNGLQLYVLLIKFSGIFNLLTFRVFCAHVYVLYFMICSTSYSLSSKLLNPWNVGKCVCLHACIQIFCMYVTYILTMIALFKFGFVNQCTGVVLLFMQFVRLWGRAGGLTCSQVVLAHQLKSQVYKTFQGVREQTRFICCISLKVFRTDSLPDCWF